MISHLNRKNKPNLVNITRKKITKRSAVARGSVVFSKKIFNKILNLETKKGSIETIASLAGINATKKTNELIPLCHNILIENIDIKILTDIKKNCINVIAQVETHSKTGVEMEALTAASISCLTIYDMCKSLDKSIIIEKIELLSKKGGKSDFLKKNR